MTVQQVVPNSDSIKSKKEQVSEMFDDISGSYDLLNHLLSMGIDKGWRKKVIEILADGHPKEILDVATGTADLAIAEAKLKPKQITGIDISEGMLTVGRKKIKGCGLDKVITLLKADSEALPFKDNSFDAATAAFGVRNFENLKKGLGEMYRVIRPEGKVVILEFSQPEKFPFKQLYFFYFRTVLPSIGALISKNKKAYTYLPESVSKFPYGKDFVNILEEIGFKETRWQTLSFGICTIYSGIK